MTTETHTAARVTSPRRRGVRIVVYALLLIAIGALGWFLASTGVFKPKPRLALVTSSEDPYWDLVIRGAEDAAKRFDVRLTVIRSPGDEEIQTQKITELLAQNYDGIAVSPINPTKQAPWLSQAATETRLVTFDSDSPVTNRLCFIGTDNYTAGRTCAEMVRQAAPDGGEIVISIGTLDKENGRLRRQGVIDELMERSYEPQRAMDPPDKPLVGPKYTLITQDDGFNAQRATDMAVEAIKSRPKLKCFVGLFAYSTPALLKALEQSKKLGQIQVVGFDLNEPTLAGIEAGNVYATMMQDQYGCGFDTIRILSDAARGQRYGLPVFPVRALGCEPVTKKNIAEVREHLRSGGPPATTQPAT